MDGSIGDLELRSEIDRFRENGGLALTTPLRRLFDFLAEWSLAEKPVGEIDIAIEVFRKSGADPGDASVRVYVHRLRKKLEDYYDKLGAAAPVRLVIPRGEYRLAVTANALAAEPEAPAGLSRRAMVIGAGSAAGVLAAGGAGALLATKGPWVNDPYRDVRRSQLWTSAVANPRQIYLVLGDYYIFGETDKNGGIARMVREFDVNSRLDLGQFLTDHPDKVGRYVDLDLTYLPLGAALGLTELLPFLKSIARGGVLHTVTASELEPDMLKSGHVVYVGYLSGLGKLENTVFTGSRFGVGEDFPAGTKVYDELLDRDTRLIYPSQAGRPADNRMHHDYGYIASFGGPNGNRIVVLAGTRDIGVMQSADVATNVAELKTLDAGLHGVRSFEAVYEVEGLGRMNMDGHLIVATPRPSSSTE